MRARALRAHEDRRGASSGSARRETQRAKRFSISLGLNAEPIDTDLIFKAVDVDLTLEFVHPRTPSGTCSTSGTSAPAVGLYPEVEVFSGALIKADRSSAPSTPSSTSAACAASGSSGLISPSAPGLIPSSAPGLEAPSASRLSPPAAASSKTTGSLPSRSPSCAGASVATLVKYRGSISFFYDLICTRAC